MAVKIKDIKLFLEASNIEFEYYGDSSLEIPSFCSLNNLKDNSIFWIKKAADFDSEKLCKYKNMLMIINSEQPIEGINYINCRKPKEVFFSVLNRFWGKENKKGIEPTAIVETENIGKDVYIGHNTYINSEVTIGDNVRIMDNVSILCPTKIGDNTIIWSGVVIGADGFGYYQDEEGINRKVPHYGGVRIGENVEIGANTCIDRGTLDDTVIGDDTKIDNLCNIGHNTNIGKNVLIIGLSEICGSCHIGDNAYIAPQTAILNQSKIGTNSYVGMGSIVIRDVRENERVFGNPAKRIMSPGERK